MICSISLVFLILPNHAARETNYLGRSYRFLEQTGHNSELHFYNFYSCPKKN